MRRCGASGVPGTLSNQPPGATSAPIGGAPTNPGAADKNGGANSQNRRESVTNYANDKTVRHVRSASGSIRRLSAAVVINHKRAPGINQARRRSLPAEELTRARRWSRKRWLLQGARRFR